MSADVRDEAGAAHYGVKWLGLSLGLSRLIRLATTAVLAHLLLREHFGLVTLANTAIFALAAIKEVGFGQALVQREDRGEEDLARAADTVFVLVGVSNLALFLVGWLATPWIAGFFEEMPGLQPVLRAMFVLFLIEGLAVTPSSLLQKRLEFGLIAVNEILATVVYAVIAIAGALLGWEVWSLVIGNLVSRTWQAVGLVRLSGWRPRLKLHGDLARELFRFGRWLWGGALLQTISRAADKMVMGKFEGGAALGGYGIAYNLCTQPAMPVANVVNRVAFPTLSRMRAGSGSVAGAYVRALALVTFGYLPAAVGLAAVADDFVVTVYGAKWADMVPLVQVLVFFGLALAVGSIARPVLLALGRPDTVMWVGMGRQVALIALLVALAREGPQAIAWAVLLPALGSMSVGLVLAARVAGCDRGWAWAALGRTVLATVAMLAAVLAVRAVVGASPPLRLAAAVATGGASYAGASLLVNRALCLDALHHAGRVLRSK